MRRCDRGITLLQTCGIVSILAGVALIVFPYGVTEAGANRSACLSNGKFLGQAIAIYAADHDSTLPPSVTWYDSLSLDGDFAQCPSGTNFNGFRVGLVMREGLSSRNLGSIELPRAEVCLFEGKAPDANAHMALSKIERRGVHGAESCFVFLDGTVYLMKPEDVVLKAAELRKAGWPYGG